MAHSSPFDDHNAPYYCALQVVPSLAEGFCGEGKTTIARALSDALGRRFVLLIASQCAPEDVAGMPSPDNKAGITRMLPPYWFDEVKEPGGFLFADEMTTPVPSVRAPFLSVFSEYRVGQYRMHPDTIVCGAFNPADLAPNGSPLEPAMANRFFHWKWEMNRETWHAGLSDPLAPLQWQAPVFPVVPSSWRDYLGIWAPLVSEFLRSHDGLYSMMPKDGDLAFPSYRTWTYAIRCLAAAEAAGAEMHANQAVVRKMVSGCVGDTAAHQFVQWFKTRDIARVEDLLDGTVVFKHDDNRPDITLCVAAALTTAVGIPSRFTPDRWNRVAAIIGNIGTACSPEIALKHSKKLRQAAIDNGYRPSQKALKPLLDLMSAVDALLAGKGIE